ncbi:MAG: SMC family ATPase [Cyclobacteriaceae bacterium]|nr:SMC family ATPase [Cyclobacteriaceae bacterium]
MRPIRLELEGFTAFREPTKIDFDGVETFVLSGPTGSGKSSVIDAITFALYGSVPRYNDPKLVHPIVSQGLMEAKVRFDFQVNDKDYTVVRVVRKLKRNDAWGATTKEARLESDDKVLAGNASELDDEIKKLFGLDFNQFISCVVLPQGEFAKFLNEQPSKRQDLLKNLLRLQVYEQIGKRARARAANYTSTKQAYEEQLLEYSAVEPSDRKNILEKIATLESLLKEAIAIQKSVSKLEVQSSSIDESLTKMREQVELLEGLKPPKDYTTVDDRYKKLEAAYAISAKKVAEAEAVLEKVEKKLERIPDISTQKQILKEYNDMSSEKEVLVRLQRDIDKRNKQESELAKQVEKLMVELDDVQSKIDQFKDEHSAYHLSKKLSKGDKCPICDRELTAKPQLQLPRGTKEIEAIKLKIETAIRDAQENHQDAKNGVATISGSIASTKTRLALLEKALRNVPSVSEIKAAMKIYEDLQSELLKAKENVKASRRAEKEALQAKEVVLKDLKLRWKHFDSVRDTVAELKPPASDKEKYDDSWNELTTWANKLGKKMLGQIDGLLKEESSIQKKIQNAYEPLIKDMRKQDINVDENKEIKEELVELLSDAKSELKRVDQSAKKARELKDKISLLTSEIEVGRRLAQHMSANYFERWILQEAFENLVFEGSKKLEELTSGNFSFAIDERLNFDIIDHRNADERRSSKTLSGGETFLASLALALTLSEQIAQLASEGSAPLESIFLDEGFGTLDPETLETVASAIEELASKGRVIGLVTHVKELADRIPVQFQVTKGSSTSTVKKIVL